MKIKELLEVCNIFQEYDVFAKVNERLIPLSGDYTVVENNCYWNKSETKSTATGAFFADAITARGMEGKENCDIRFLDGSDVFGTDSDYEISRIEIRNDKILLIW